MRRVRRCVVAGRRVDPVDDGDDRGRVILRVVIRLVGGDGARLVVDARVDLDEDARDVDGILLLMISIMSFPCIKRPLNSYT